MKFILPLIMSIILTPLHSYAQTRENYTEETSGSGSCGKKIILFNDGSYNLESGCPGALHFSFGRWTQKKDTVFFAVTNNKTFTVIKNITAATVAGKNLTVKILDNKGQNITNRISIGQYIKNKGSYMLNPDSTKTVKIDYKRDGGILILRSLQKLFDQKIEIETGVSNYFEITLNISGEWIFPSSADWGGNGDFKLKKTKQELLSLNAEKIVFIREQQ